MPITGYNEDERRSTCKSERASLVERFGPDTVVVTPFDFADIIRENIPVPTYGTFMCEDLAYIIDEADIVDFIVDPRETKSRGVRAEFAIAQIYGKKTIWQGVEL